MRVKQRALSRFIRSSFLSILNSFGSPTNGGMYTLCGLSALTLPDLIIYTHLYSPFASFSLLIVHKQRANFHIFRGVCTCAKKYFAVHGRPHLPQASSLFVYSPPHCPQDSE